VVPHGHPKIDVFTIPFFYVLPHGYMAALFGALQESLCQLVVQLGSHVLLHLVQLLTQLWMSLALRFQRCTRIDLHGASICAKEIVSLSRKALSQNGRMKKKSAKFGAAPWQKCALETPMTESSASAAPSSSARSWDRAIAYDSSVCIGFNNDSK
jgi:hypothetical protein